VGGGREGLLIKLHFSKIQEHATYSPITITMHFIQRTNETTFVKNFKNKNWRKRGGNHLLGPHKLRNYSI
jgi:hypothetical protein